MPSWSLIVPVALALAVTMPPSAHPTSAQAATHEPAASLPSPQYAGCLTRAGASTVQRGMCAQGELTRQDARLNRAYQALMAAYARGGPATTTENPQQRTLREEERAWIADRDQVCRLNHDTVDNVCLIERESARADEFAARLRRLP